MNRFVKTMRTHWYKGACADNVGKAEANTGLEIKDGKSEYQLEARNLCRTYVNSAGTFPVLKGIDLTVKKGEFVGIMGPSGAGKSTLIKTLATIERPTEGEVLVEGKRLSEMNENALAEFRRHRLGFIFQNYNLLSQMTVYENIALPMILAKRPQEEQHMKVFELAQQFRIDQLLDKNPAELSGGEQQRVTAARALIMDPAVIFADEPTGALDSESGSELMNLLTEMNRKRNATIIMVTHDAGAAAYCDRIISIRDGKILADADAFNRPA